MHDNERRPDTEQERFGYTKPEIADYGDLVEVTAAGAVGSRVDATFTTGQVATFLSTSP